MMSAERTKRKLSAILSADVKGYSRLMEKNEMATIQTLKVYREVITSIVLQYGGRVVDSPGDNLLAEFGSVVEAVDCSVKIQQALKTKNAELPEDRKMKFRIGVNLGDVIQDGERLYGDGVNIAARVESFAEGGGICLSGTAYDHVGKKLALGYVYLGKQTLKNIEKPARVYRVLMDPEYTGKVILDKRIKARQRRRAIIAGLMALLLVFGALAIWKIYLRAPQVDPGSMKKMGRHMPDKSAMTPTAALQAEKKQLADEMAQVERERRELEQMKARIAQKEKISELEAEKKRLADEAARLERERHGLEQMKALIEQKEKISELEAEKKRLDDKMARVDSDRQELGQLKALFERKKGLETEISRLEVEKKTIETNKRKELEIQTKGNGKQNLANIPKEPPIQVDQQLSSGPPYNLAIFPWMLQNEANFYLHHALNRIIDDIKKRDTLTLKSSFYQIELVPGVKKIDDSVINSSTFDDLWLKKSSIQKGKPNMKLVRQIGSELNVDGVLMLYFDVKTEQAIDINVKKIIIYLIDIKTGKLFSERNRTAVNLYHGNFNDALDSLLSKVFNRYLKQKAG
jgi:adenylate cyclase